MIAPCPAPFNLAAYVLEKGAQYPDKVALVVMGPAKAERWSYARLTAAVMGMAGALADRAEPGARVMLRLGNTPEFPVAFLGAIAAGLVPVPTSPMLTGPEITRFAGALPPDLILAAPGIALPDIDAPVLTNIAAMMSQPPGRFVMGDPDRLAYVMFTSGSSGLPRAVAHAHRAIWARRMMWDGWYGLSQADRVCHAGAFNWTFTLGTGLLDPWSVGGTALIPAPEVGADQLPLLLKRHDASIFAAVPGVYRKILKRPLPPLPRLRHGLAAGETLPQTIRAAWQEATGTDIHEALGMSECSTFLSGSPSRPAPPGTAGYPQPGRRIAVLDDTGAEAAEGILAIHRSDPGLMLGYLQDGKPALPLQGDWFLTGDRVCRDDTGAIAFQARNDELMNAGGFRVSPHEIEAAFAAAAPDCAACEVEIKPGAKVIALAFEGDAGDTELRSLAEARLAPYKQPRLYVHLETLPRSANGKLARARLARLIKERLP